MSPDDQIRQIAETPALVEEARACLPALKAVAEAKAGEDGIRAVIGRRLATYPQPARTDGEWAAWWADYVDVLADVSLASLEAGMRAHVADPASEFMPKPGRLRELAFLSPSRSLTRYYRAKRAVEIADTPQVIAGPRVDPGEVRAILADFNAKAIPPKASRATMPSTAGKTDQGGLTAEMRELIARRQHQ